MTDFFELALPGIRGLQPYQPGKPVEELERELGISNIIKLASNENPLGPSIRVVESLKNHLDELARYPDGSAFDLKAALAVHLAVNENQLTIGNGSNDVLELLAHAFLSPSEEMIVSQHCFVVYPLAARAIGAQLKVIPAKNYGQDLEATLAAISPATRMIFIANPNNPTGTWLIREQVTAFLDQVPDSVLVVLDEAYFDYVSDPDYPDGIRLLKQYPNLVVTRTFSKAYGLAALRVGFSVSHPDVADLLNRIRQPFNVNAMALHAARIALDDREHLQASVTLNRQQLQAMQAMCDQMGLSYIPSAGNFLTIDVGTEALPVYEALLREGVIVRPIGGYELPNHLRVTIGTAEENIRFGQALGRVLKRA